MSSSRVVDQSLIVKTALLNVVPCRALAEHAQLGRISGTREIIDFEDIVGSRERKIWDEHVGKNPYIVRIYHITDWPDSLSFDKPMNIP